MVENTKLLICLLFENFYYKTDFKAAFENITYEEKITILEFTFFFFKVKSNPHSY